MTTPNAPSVPIEEAIRDAIVQKFFEPTTTVTSQIVFDGSGSQHIQAVPVQTDAPAMVVARTIWNANQQAITDAVNRMRPPNLGVERRRLGDVVMTTMTKGDMR